MSTSDDHCCWKEDEDGVWDTDCGNNHLFIADGPIENNAKFCCYCGKSIMALPYPFGADCEDDDDAR